jgi:NTE family protein
VLYRRLHRELALQLLLPWNLIRLASPWYARSDVVGEYYSRAIFERKRFADLPKTRPLIVLNATDIVEGAQFSFTQEYFDRLCADLGPVPIGRAVVASSAFPVAFTPVTLRNYPKQSCGYVRPGALVDLAQSAESNPTGYSIAKSWLSYENAKRRFIHLSDGGLSDNLGLRAPYNALELDTWGLRELINAEPYADEPRKIKRLVFIVVDAKPKSDSPHDGSARPPSIYTVLNAAGSNPMENYSTETIAVLNAWFNQWNVQAEQHANTTKHCGELARDQCPAPGCSRAERERRRISCLAHFGVWDPVTKQPMKVPHPDLYMVHVRFDAMPEGPMKHDLQNVDTALQLPREQVDALIEWGGRLLQEAPDYRRLVRDLEQSRATAGTR